MKKKKRVNAVQSYKESLADLSLKNMAPYIQQQVAEASRAVAQQQANLMQSLILRLLVLEELATLKMGVTKEELASLVASKEDEALGYEEVETAQDGDTVRVTINSTIEGESAPQTSKFVFRDLGKDMAGGAVGDAIRGKKKGDIAEVSTDNHKMTIQIDRISRVKEA